VHANDLIVLSMGTLLVSLLTSCGAPSARPDERPDPLMNTPLFAEGSTYRFRIRATTRMPQLIETNASGTLTIAAVRPDGTAELVWDFGPVTLDSSELPIRLPPLRAAEPHTQRERRDQRGRQVERSDDTAPSVGFSFGLGLLGAELPPREVGVAETWPVTFEVPDELAEDNEGTCGLIERGDPTILGCELEATAEEAGARAVLVVETETSLKPGAPLTRRVVLRGSVTAGGAETTFEHELCLVPEGSELSEAGCEDAEDHRPVATAYVDQCEERVAAFEARFAELPPPAPRLLTVSPLPAAEGAQPMRAMAIVEVSGDEGRIDGAVTATPELPAALATRAEERTDGDDRPLIVVAAGANEPLAEWIETLTALSALEDVDVGLAVEGPPFPEVDPVPEAAAEWLRALIEERIQADRTERVSMTLPLMAAPGGLCFPTMLYRRFAGDPRIQASWLAQRATTVPEAIRGCGCQSVDIDAVEALLVLWSKDHPPFAWLPLHVVAEGGTAVRLAPGATFQDLATAIEARGDRASQGLRLVLRAR
jgi:hypothetical protein